MKSMYRTAMIIAALVFLLPLSARAEIRAGSVEVNPFVGYNFFQNSQNLKNAPIYGGRLGYNFTKYFGFEVAGEFIRTNVDDTGKTDFTEGQFGHPMDRVDFYSYHIDAVLHLIPDGIFNPFIVAGFGGAHYSPSISNGGDMAAFNVGIGTKIWLTDNIALRFDVQDYMVGEIFQETYHNIGVTAGLVFAFGGKAKPEPVAKAEPLPEPVVDPVPEPEPVVVAPPPPPPPPPPAPMPVIIEKGRQTLDVKFDFDKSIIKGAYNDDIDNLSGVMKDYPDLKVVIEGHTDSVGTNAYNINLSRERAAAVKNYMVEKNGIDSSRIATVGFGENKPVADNATAKGRAKNRRVEAAVNYIIEK
jgi:OOP family OmpA-OmpF porin